MCSRLRPKSSEKLVQKCTIRRAGAGTAAQGRNGGLVRVCGSCTIRGAMHARDALFAVFAKVARTAQSWSDGAQTSFGARVAANPGSRASAVSGAPAAPTLGQTHLRRPCGRLGELNTREISQLGPRYPGRSRLIPFCQAAGVFTNRRAGSAFVRLQDRPLLWALRHRHSPASGFREPPESHRRGAEDARGFPRISIQNVDLRNGVRSALNNFRRPNTWIPETELL
jgi:hypothetical protein